MPGPTRVGCPTPAGRPRPSAHIPLDRTPPTEGARHGSLPPPPTPSHRPATTSTDRGVRGRPARLDRPSRQPGLRRAPARSTTRNADRQPALIVRAADALGRRAARSSWRGSPASSLSVRGGGHSLAGYGTNDGGIVLDLGAMKGLHIDPDRRLAWAQPGLTAERVHGRGRGPRARDAVRRHRFGRHRRADARRRDRLARPQVRPGHRRARGGRDRHRRRSPSSPPAPSRTPTCSGRSAAAAATSAS